MAFYHCSVKAVQRSKGQTATRSAAYRAGELIRCERTGLVHDYRRKTGVMHTEIITPAGIHAPSREQLWNMAELAERRKDSCVAREYEVALPHELTEQQRTALAQEFCKHIAETHGVAVDLCIHRPTDKEIAKGADPRNHHAHILTTTREISNDGLGAKADIEKAGRNRKKDLESIRIAWQDFANEHLAKAGLDISIDHRSHAARGLKKVPTIKIGVAAMAMERRGIKTEKGDINRAIRQGNDEIRELCERQYAEEHPYYNAPKPPATAKSARVVMVIPTAEPAPAPARPARPARPILNSDEYTTDDALAEIFSPRVSGNSAKRALVHEVLKRGIYEQYNRKGYNHEYDDARMKKINEIADVAADVAMKTKTVNPYDPKLRLDAINTLKERMDVQRVEYDIPNPAPAPKPAPKPAPATARERDDDYDYGM